MLTPTVNLVIADIDAAALDYQQFDATAQQFQGVVAANAAAVKAPIAPIQNRIAQVNQALIGAGPGGRMEQEAPMSHWAAGLLMKTLDVTGVKELAQNFATPGGVVTSSGVRDLSAGEEGLANAVYGSSVDLNDVQILENSRLPGLLGLGNNAFTAANTIHRNRPFTAPADAIAETKDRGVLMHEVLHIAQEQKQGMLAWIDLEWGRRQTRERHPRTWDQDYDYGVIDANTRFRDFTREQQSAIVQEYSTFLEMHIRALTNPVPTDMIHGERGSGQYRYYRRALRGLSSGDWTDPMQSEAWKETLG